MRIDVYHHIPGTLDESKVKLILAGIMGLENHMSKQDTAIDALKTAFDSFKADVSANLDNIAEDEKNILGQLATLDGLTPANQAKVDQIVTDMGTLAAKTKTLADAIPDVPPPPAPAV